VNLIWSLLHFDQNLIGILGYQKLITLDSYGRLDLMRMHTLFLNTFSKTCICINNYTPSLTQYLIELKSKYKDELSQDVLIRSICS
jgi:hypothetical protein